MKIYNYHPITKEYTGESIADIDPEESKLKKKDVFLVPYNATEKQPPAKSKNKVACFENDKWIIKPDFRGKTGFHRETREEIIITEIGDLPGYFSETKPLPTKKELEEIEKLEAQAFLSRNNTPLDKFIEQNKSKLLDLGFVIPVEIQDILDKKQAAREKINK
jgi:hypothetical protein